MEARTHRKQMTAVGYISDIEDIIESSWSKFQCDGVAAIQFSERSSLPPTMSAKNVSGGRTKILNICQIERFNSHPFKKD